jgi:TPR repeat protein
MVEAQYQLGQMYHYGKGVQRDLKQALVWYQTAAEQGLKEAQFNTAKLILSGIGDHYDYDGAIQYYQLAAEQGMVEAQLNLAQQYHYNPNQKDYLKAHHWYTKAAKARIT